MQKEILSWPYGYIVKNDELVPTLKRQIVTKNDKM